MERQTEYDSSIDKTSRVDILKPALDYSDRVLGGFHQHCGFMDIASSRS